MKTPTGCWNFGTSCPDSSSSWTSPVTSPIDIYLEASGRGEYFLDRIERGTVHIPRVVVSILGGIQPGPLGRYLRGAISGTGEEDDGLIPRFQLLVYPDQPADWEVIDEPPDGKAHDRAARSTGVGSTGIPPSSVPDRGRGQPPVPAFSCDAQELFFKWWSSLETKESIRPGGSRDRIASKQVPSSRCPRSRCFST